VRVAVVGHVEWVEFAIVERVPLAGEIEHAQGALAEPAGGGAGAAVQLARLAGSADLYTALGDDHWGACSRARLAELSVNVHAATRAEPTRRAFTFLDAAHERTITTLGDRLEPAGDDNLDWAALAQTDAVYLTAGDPAAVRKARSARILVATPRAGQALSGVAADAIVYSAGDARECRLVETLDIEPTLLVATEGAGGGSWRASDGSGGRWEPAPLPGELVDSYGAGDCFAAGLTYALGAGQGIEAALALAATCGAWCACGRGPYGRLYGPA
jgi:ribokinase